MMLKMSDAVFCAAHFHENGYCLARHANCHGNHCPNWHRKWPTPEEYQEEYKQEPDDEMAVYLKIDGVWVVVMYHTAKNAYKGNPVVIACTPFSCPRSNWSPE